MARLIRSTDRVTPQASNLAGAGRGILLALDRSLADYVATLGDLGAPAFAIGGRKLDVRNLGIEFQQDAIDMTSLGDSMRTYCAGTRRALFKIEAFGIPDGDMLGEPLKIDEALGKMRVQATLRVTSVRGLFAVDSVNMMEIRAIAIGEVRLLDEPSAAAELPKVLRAIRLA